MSIGAAKIATLSSLTLVTFVGSLYGSTILLKEEEIPWQSLWIYKEKQAENNENWRTICNLPNDFVQKNKLKKDSETNRVIESYCNSSPWFQEIIKNNKEKKKDGWWLRGRDEKTISEMLKGEPLAGEKIPEKLGRKNEPPSQEEQPVLKIEDLRKFCSVTDRTFFRRKIEIVCIES
ncbi:hypothetical protein MSUIS_06240 [Mycoplasma suis KI3806]|uniref:Uncharacterized protein n=1 Tax=Mycoplasma suis (strain KI_3806) TaxID=708248 RepID=F0V236_MYCS3|nr:hypothetical protein [Mycoplasma suis]CBZ40717.1 hypothetical protein MSUIS_06240 [Mycoplasma suis KI3806]